MRIHCYGAGGSIPTSGEHDNKHGGDTTCLEFHTEHGATVIIDAG